jgi:hypothetical protein
MPHHIFLATSPHYDLVKMGTTGSVWYLRNTYQNSYGNGLQLWTWEVDSKSVALHDATLFMERFIQAHNSESLFVKTDNLPAMLAFCEGLTTAGCVTHVMDVGTDKWTPEYTRAGVKSAKRRHEKPRTAGPDLLSPARQARKFARDINSGRCTSPDPALIVHHQIVFDPVLVEWRLAKPGEWDSVA